MHIREELMLIARSAAADGRPLGRAVVPCGTYIAHAASAVWRDHSLRIAQARDDAAIAVARDLENVGRMATRAKAKAKAKVTTDHDEIRRWAETRGGHPASVKGTSRGKQDVGMIRIDFPGYSGEGKLEEISWDEWFDKFDESGLALIVQEKTAGGQRSNFNKLVSRETAEEASKGTRGSKRASRTSSRRRTSRSSAKSKSRSKSKSKSRGRRSTARR